MDPEPEPEPDSSNLIFSPITLKDRPFLSQLLKNPHIAQNFLKGSEYADEEIGDMLDTMLHFWINNNLGFYVVYEDQTPVALAGFNYLQDFDEVEVVYCVVQSKWGQGLASSVLKKLMDIGLNEFNLQKLLGIVKKENMGSYKVLTKNGFNYVKNFEEKNQEYILLEIFNHQGIHKNFLHPKEVGL